MTNENKLGGIVMAANTNNSANQGISGGMYGLGFIGALIYFISNAISFWGGVIGFFKALVWPAFLVYGLFEYIGM